MENGSKPISKTDDYSKQFIIDCLNGDNTHGFDIDSIYFYDGKWCLFEYLKCESKNVTPHTSDPKFYAYNWRKFYSLYALASELNGRLILVNYSTRESDGDLVKVMEVLSFNYEKAKAYNNEKVYEYMKLKETRMKRAEFSQWLRKINRNAEMPTFTAYDLGENDEI